MCHCPTVYLAKLVDRTYVPVLVMKQDNHSMTNSLWCVHELSTTEITEADRFSNPCQRCRTKSTTFQPDPSRWTWFPAPTTCWVGHKKWERGNKSGWVHIRASAINFTWCSSIKTRTWTLKFDVITADTISWQASYVPWDNMGRQPWKKDLMAVVTHTVWATQNKCLC